MGLRYHLYSLCNRVLRRYGARMMMLYDVEELRIRREHVDLTEEPSFKVAGREFSSFAHRHNCGWPGFAWCTERTVELAVADRWLDLVPSDLVTEIGAVTPYYWPRRVADVVDPTDPHRQVTRRNSIFDGSLVGRAVLSISTFEHIGIGDYGLAPEEGLAAAALEKLFAESTTFLVTFASGYNPALDRFVLSRSKFPPDVEVYLLARNSPGIGWTERPVRQESLQPYLGDRGGSVFILHRGTPLFRSTGA